MQGTNPTEFEKWCAKEMGLTESYVKSNRKINTFGMLQYRNAEIEKRFMAYKAGLISGASIGCSHAKVQGTNWVKCSDSLPEDNTEVLVYCDDTKEMMVAYLDDDGDFCWLDQEILGTQLICYPSHWMPLPPMPEGEWWE
ncbi:DUF551 domain-containing protein [Providencia stuartii]|nr:DUF551 domain-containing protein [Providencia stuartii]